MSKPPSLGDAEQVQLKLVKETTPLPKTRPEIVNAFARLLEKGGVQRVVIQLNEPIKVERLVRADQLEDVPPELQEEGDDPFTAVRNAPMLELEFSEKHSPFKYLFKAFHLLSQKRLRPKVFLVRDMATLREWLEVDQAFFNVQELFGVEVRESRDLPKDTGLLAAVAPEETDVNAVSLTVRLSLNVKLEEIEDAGDEAHREEGAGVGPGGQAHGPADGAVGVPAGGLNGTGKAGGSQGRNQGAAPQAGGGNRKRGR